MVAAILLPLLLVLVREESIRGVPAALVQSPVTGPGRRAQGSSLGHEGTPHFHPRRRTGGAGAPGQGSGLVVKPVGDLFAGRWRAAFNHRKGAGFGSCCATCPRGPATIFPPGKPVLPGGCSGGSLRGSGLLGVHGAGLGVAVCDSRSYTGKRPASSSTATRRAPRGPGLWRVWRAGYSLS